MGMVRLPAVYSKALNCSPTNFRFTLSSCRLNAESVALVHRAGFSSHVELTFPAALGPGRISDSLPARTSFLRRMDSEMTPEMQPCLWHMDVIDSDCKEMMIAEKRNYLDMVFWC
ncbi:uncharacterized protein LOC128230051 [Mya arenaria]|uniref:uncharacterized protein LOC128230051 n=1 Tax=Mya arenaria TaxID=6604 RepID=UPI0022E92FAC|nr:uncharacterized protein LOC128230051 [Mya arenaria]XP_052797999.1 uncharacterized protein LOC128230051 [Mya arenaria]